MFFRSYGLLVTSAFPVTTLSVRKLAGLAVVSSVFCRSASG